MGSDFDGDPSRPQGTKRLHHPSFGCRDLPLAEDLTLVTQHAITTGLVSQIHPDRHAFLCAFVLHCGLLTLLRAATFLHGRSPLHRKWRNREHIASRGRRPSHSISEVILSACRAVNVMWGYQRMPPRHFAPPQSTSPIR